VGRDWQAGSEIAHDVGLPADIHPGDLLAIACTGAYHHSMGSSCNLAGSPPLVAVAAGQPHELVRRETVADLLARDRGWPGNPYPGRAATAS
jgi:diaminopimelate decarboxylase